MWPEAKMTSHCFSPASGPGEILLFLFAETHLDLIGAESATVRAAEGPLCLAY